MAIVCSMWEGIRWYAVGFKCLDCGYETEKDALCYDYFTPHSHWCRDNNGLTPNTKTFDPDKLDDTPTVFIAEG